MGSKIKLSWADRFKWWNAYLFITCGAVMIYRSYHTSAAWLATTTGIVFLAFGLYRLRLIRRTLNGEISPSNRAGMKTPRPRF